MNTDTQPALVLHHMVKHFPLKGRGLRSEPLRVHAVDDVSLTINSGETFALVGESGCGKSTIGRLVARLVDPTSGQIFLNGQRFDTLAGQALRHARRNVQLIFQDPFGSLDPRMRVGEVIAQPLLNFGLMSDRRSMTKRVGQLLEMVGLPADSGNRFPHEFSGGQRQRIAIARALAPEPKMIVCDEAVSALDVSVKAQVVGLLAELQSQLGLTLLFISHDLAIVEQLAHRVAVMYLGKIVELSPSLNLFEQPAHPYTQALLSAVPVPDPFARIDRVILKGEIPSSTHPPSGCRFRTRCPKAFERCAAEEPALRPTAGGGVVACHLA
ncbi:ABC transporter ATP-binding protein [Variovorax sp. LT1R20]|uniref:ABC transporter ATP-binding protein n=1 Tax=Variovorax sp. LT1R20 TaxID=3443729 RepID=UPI003F45BB74